MSARLFVWTEMGCSKPDYLGLVNNRIS